MRKLFLIFLFFNQLYAELILEITQGTDDPYRVAILPFTGDTEMSEELESIIKNNLNRSGEFETFGEEELLSSPTSEEEIVFNDFKIVFPVKFSMAYHNHSCIIASLI